jgi:hypothetical protein
VYQAGIHYWDYEAYGGWTTGHAAYRVTMCDGTNFYFDNGLFGKPGGVFTDKDIPSDAT